MAHDVVRLRGAGLWCAATGAAAGIAWAALPTIGSMPATLQTGAGFAEVLVAGCAVATVAAAGWLWVLTTDVVVGVLRSDGRVAVRRPGPLRLLLLSACGAVVLSATAAPATADDSLPIAPHSLVGLPLPDRATTDAAPSQDRSSSGPTPTQVRVRPGDSLWAIAESRLGPGATVAEIVAYWQRIYDSNADVIGPDPDLILPGQLLELPPTG